MNALRIAAVAVVCLALSATFALAIATEDKRDPREQLETAIPEGIRLLEAKEHATFIKMFSPPEMVKRMTENGQFAKVVEEFTASGAAELALTLLQEIKGKKPKLSPDGKKATYELAQRAVGAKSITFIKIGNYWYLDM